MPEEQAKTQKPKRPKHQIADQYTYRPTEDIRPKIEEVCKYFGYSRTSDGITALQEAGYKIFKENPEKFLQMRQN